MTLRTSTSQYIAVAVFLTVNNLVYNTLPIILGGLATQRGFDEAQIGLLGSAFLAGQMITNITGPLWVARVNWKKVLTAAMAVFAVSMALSAHVGYSMIALFYVIGGGMTGISLACMFCLISNMANPVRAYSIALMSQCVIAGVLVIIFQSFALPLYGLEGLSYLITGLILVAILFVVWVPVNMSAQKETVGDDASSEFTDLFRNFAPWAFVGLLGVTLYYTGQTGVWAFVERIGNSRAFDPDFIGIVASGSLILSGLGAWAADLTGDKLGNFKPLIVGIAVFIFAMILLAATEHPYLYFLAITLYSCAWNYMTPFQLLVVSRADPSGTYASMIPAFQAIGSSLGPAMIGVLIVTSGGYTIAYLVAIAMALMCLVFFGGAHKNTQS